MSIDVTCANCGKTLHAKDAAAGKAAKCPQCGEVIRIPRAPARASDAVPDDDILEAEIIAESHDLLQSIPPLASMPQPDDNTPRAACPKCGEQIPVGAAKCRFCKTVLDPRLAKFEKSKDPADEKLSPVEWFVALVCSGIGCILSLLWLVQGKPKWKIMMPVSCGMVIFWNIVRLVIVEMNS